MQCGLTDALAPTLFFWRTNRLRRVPGDGASPMHRSVFMSDRRPPPTHFDFVPFAVHLFKWLGAVLLHLPARGLSKGPFSSRYTASASHKTRGETDVFLPSR